MRWKRRRPEDFGDEIQSHLELEAVDRQPSWSVECWLEQPRGVSREDQLTRCVIGDLADDTELGRVRTVSEAARGHSRRARVPGRRDRSRRAARRREPSWRVSRSSARESTFRGRRSCSLRRAGEPPGSALRQGARRLPSTPGTLQPRMSSTGSNHLVIIRIRNPPFRVISIR